jgi:hypothetical protein
MKCVYLVKFKQLTALRRHSRWNRPNQSDSLQRWAQLDTVLNWGLESPQNPQAGRRHAGAALWRAAKAERPALREPLSKHTRQPIFHPRLREVEERAGERRRVFIGNSPLLNPLPTRSSRGEEESTRGFERTSRSADIPVRGFGRLSSRPALPAQTFRPGTVSRACCPNCRAGFRACRLRSFPTSRTKADSLTRNPGTGKSPEPADRNVCPTSEAECDLGNTPQGYGGQDNGQVITPNLIGSNRPCLLLQLRRIG